jgi:predicted nucleotidyltransferase
MRPAIAALIDRDRKAFEALMRDNSVHALYAFGSSVKGPFTESSDVDVLVDVAASDEEAGRMLINVWNGLEALFKRPVDLLTDTSLRNPFLRAEIERTKQLIYDGDKCQILV